MIWRIPLLLLSALSLNLVSPPVGLHWLHWVAFVPMFIALPRRNTRVTLGMGWLYGTVAVATLFRWLANTIDLFSNLPMPVAVLIVLLFGAVFGAPYALLWAAVHPLRRRVGALWPVAIAAWLVLIEYGSMQVLLFPYNQGAGQYRVAEIWQLVSVTGIWGVSFLIMLVNGVFAEITFRIREGGRFPTKSALGAAAALALTIGFGVWRYNAIEAALDAGDKLRVAQVQSPNGMEWRLKNGPRAVWKEWSGYLNRVQPGTADLVVLPEGACPMNLAEAPPGKINRARDLIGTFTQLGQYELLVGAGSRRRVGDASLGEDQVRVRNFNSVFHVMPDGSIAGQYDKMVPLAFGEYLPFGEYFPGLAKMIGGISDFKAGDTPVVFEGSAHTYASPICYEAILPSVTREFRSAELLVNVTNDAWFGDTAAPHQHAMLAAIRATELGRPMFRSAYTGVSMVIEPHGRIHSETKPFETVHRIVPVRMATFTTVYSRLGDWFVVVSLLLLLGLIALGDRLPPATER